ncbi:MAG: hypothetical protein ACJA1A_003659 [Saprospiraceae bacterium]|jgi:hypothetical protein|tara:strand:- start:1513 stop:2322 length:810 start_codon:yes stop_codon:yes gene_type:complete
MKLSIYILSLCLLSFTSCKDKGSVKITPAEQISATAESNHPAFVTNLEFSHEKDEVYKNEMICFNLDMTFGKNKSLMKIFTTPNSSAIRMDKQNGISTIMLDGKTYTNAEKSEWENEKFGIYTYQYFFMAPYKFSDPGTKWEKRSPMEIKGTMTNVAKLTFEEGTGDASNDWYMVHSNPESNLVEHIGYIVTGGGTSVEEAEKHAHAISYLDYIQVGGVPMSSRWLFSDYNQDSGLGEQIGEGILRNIDFMDVDNQFSIALTDEYSLVD